MGRLIGLTSLAPILFSEDDEQEYDSYRGPSIDIANIRAKDVKPINLP